MAGLEIPVPLAGDRAEAVRVPVVRAVRPAWEAPEAAAGAVAAAGGAAVEEDAGKP